MIRLAFAVLLLALVPFSARSETNSPALNLTRQLNNAFIEVAEKVSPSVVVIKIAHKPGALERDDAENPLWDLIPREFRKQMEEEWDKRRKKAEEEEKDSNRPPVFDGQGSGIIIRDDGYILTNFHVVDEAEKIRVRLRDGRAFDATVQGLDAKSDMAVIKINATNLLAVKFADSEAVRVGEFAVAIGAPFELDYSVTFGHVSAKGRTDVIRSLGVTSQGATMDQDFLQTDASINPGNSGGPLVNLYGQVIGINTLIRGLHTGIGFAVPSNLAKEVADQLIANGKFTRSWLGIGIRGLREDEDSRDLSLGIDDGVLVTELRPDGPARNSDLREGDIILAVDGKKVATATQLRNEVRIKKAGSAVTLDVYRKSKQLQIKVHPETWPEPTKPAAKPAGENRRP
jgi:serine protease Do